MKIILSSKEKDDVAKSWAKKYSLKEIIGFQKLYENYLKTLSPLTEEELKGKETENSKSFQFANQNLEILSDCVDILSFRKDKK